MGKIIFKDNEHLEFYTKMLAEAKKKSVYHRSLIYTLGICPETRRHIDRLYGKDGIRIEGLNDPWQTSGTIQICRLAFNLFNGFRYTGTDWDHIKPCTGTEFTPYDLFCNSDAAYMLEAIKIRFPEYFREREAAEYGEM